MKRMVTVVQTFLIDVDAATSHEAEAIVAEMLESGKIDLEDPTAYTISDCGPGSWED